MDVHQHPQASPERTWTAFWVLLGSMFLTVVATYSAARLFDTRDQMHFENGVRQTKQAIEQRLNTYVDMLVLGSTLHGASNGFNREQFHRYVSALRFNERYPGIQGIGFSLRILPHEKAKVEEQLREGGRPFRIWPEHERPEYHSIVYLEPLDLRNQRAIGYDMFTDPVRQAAMAAARDSARPAASGKVTLVQETENGTQPGFLIYVPVYRGNQLPSSLEERRRDLVGFVYSPFRAWDLLRAIVGDEGRWPVDFRVFDGHGRSMTNLLYQSPDLVGNARRPRYQRPQTLELAGRAWTLEFASGTSLESTSGAVVVPFIALGGLGVSLLLFRLSSKQAQAAAEAERSAIELRASQAKLAASEELHRMVTAGAADAVLSLDEQQRIRAINPATERMFGYPAAELLGQPVTVLVPSLTAQRSLPVALTPADPKPGAPSEQVDLVARHRDGHSFPVEMSLNGYVRDAHLFYTAILRDITHRKKAEEEIQRLNQELEERVRRRTAALQETNQQLEAFTYTVAHDLRAPLRAMQGFSQALLEDFAPQMNSTQLDYTRRVIAASQRMDTLIQDLLAYSRLSRAALTLESVPIEAVLQRVLQTFSGEIEQREAVVDVALPLPAVLAHPSTLEVVLANLISNALKFVGPGVAPHVRISADVKEPWVQLRVADNGIGIAEEYQERIFRVFERLHGNESFPGTGIGLAIVRKGVQRMGGRVGVRSAVDQGSTFWIELPAAPAGPSPADPPPRES